jgi:RraA family protein
MMGIGDEAPQSSELTGGPGFRIRRKADRVPQILVDRFKALDIALISDLMNRLYTLDSGIYAVVEPTDSVLIGTACTVKVFPGDNLMVHAALDIARPGEVVMVDTAGSTINAVLGDMVANKAKARGIKGFIVDGLVRDVAEMRKAGVPVFARGITPRGPLHRGPGELNYPISCGGVSVNAGDLVMAGPDGVVVVPRLDAEEILHRAEMKTAKEAEYVAAVRRGEFSNEWVHRTLGADGCDIT